MKIATVIGARPQFIKAAVVSREIRKFHEEQIIHTGQHYDYNMSELFFEQLDIPKPDYNLKISGGSHGQMTGGMLIEIEKVLMDIKPDLMVVYGDTNSTLAGALAAVKLHVPVCHVEAGGRLGTLKNPEEANRIMVDHISSHLMCCTSSAVSFLAKEGLTENVHLVGDPMFDAFQYYRSKLGEQPPEVLVDLDGNPVSVPPQFYYMTCHREENTSLDSLGELLAAMDALDYPCIYPVHPRNQEKVQELKKVKNHKNVILCKPVGYLTSVFLTSNAIKIVTDSGGLQREAFFARKQCVTIFDYVVWPETMTGNWNQLAQAKKEDILEKLKTPVLRYPEDEPFGNGTAAKRIAELIGRR